MIERLEFYIDGQWVQPAVPGMFLDVENPAKETAFATISLGHQLDVDRAVEAARRAFASFSRSSVESRASLLLNLAAEMEKRLADIAQAISQEMGAPISFARDVQSKVAVEHARQAVATLREYKFERQLKTSIVVREPIGVCGFITAWNWPLNLIMTKFAYAIAAGCTVVLKPSELAPLSACLLADCVHAAGFPAGVFNLVNGDGPTVGRAIASHPDIDLVSFTGSTRAGIEVAKNAAETVKRVHQELGGKSANILLPDADLEKTVEEGIRRAFANSGQSCQAPTRLLVHRSQVDAVAEIAARVVGSLQVGDPESAGTQLGPVASAAQYRRVQEMIQSGIAAGAHIVVGGPGKPEGLETGHFARPTVFVGVTPEMEIAQEEIFGPVLPVIAYDTEEEAIAIANGTRYGLAAYVQSADIERAHAVGRRLQAGRVYVNTVTHDLAAPFGGYKQSGNGREQGEYGLDEFLEIKAFLGLSNGK